MKVSNQFCLSIVFIAAIGLTSNASAQDRWRSHGYSNPYSADVVCPYESQRGERQNWYRSNGQFDSGAAQLEYMAPDYSASDYRLRNDGMYSTNRDTCSHGSCQLRDRLPEDGRYQRGTDPLCEYNCPYEDRGGFNNAFGNTSVPRYEQRGNAEPEYGPPRQEIPQREPTNSADQIPRLNAPPMYDPGTNSPSSVPQFIPRNNSATGLSDEDWQDVPSTSPQLNPSPTQSPDFQSQ